MSPMPLFSAFTVGAIFLAVVCLAVLGWIVVELASEVW